MDFFSAMHISSSGLAAERQRVDVATSNLANVDSTRGPDGLPYRRMDPIIAAVPFEDALQESMGVRVEGVVKDQTPGRQVYLPGHPDADGNGFVTYANVDPVHEVVNLITASRGYDANATSMETLKTMAQRALDIMR